jgi:LytTr DNA-binding domain
VTPSKHLAPLRRTAEELALLLAIAFFMGAISPYGTGALTAGRRFLYWVICIVGGGAIGIALDETIGRRAGSFWRRLATTSLLMTPGVTALVLTTGHVMTRQPLRVSSYLALLSQVFVVCVPVLAVRALVWRRPQTRTTTQIVVEPPLPEAEAAFRRRLSAKRRGAQLIAIEAHDHYLRVHTDAGQELLTLRFADALAELSGAHGYQTHRCWWVAAAAIRDVRWRRGAGEARLYSDLVVPVSRSHAPALKAAGWF